MEIQYTRMGEGGYRPPSGMIPTRSARRNVSNPMVERIADEFLARDEATRLAFNDTRKGLWFQNLHAELARSSRELVKAEQYDKLAAYFLMKQASFDLEETKRQVAIKAYNRALAQNLGIDTRAVTNIGSITSPDGQVLAFETDIDPVSMDVYSTIKTRVIWPKIARFVNGRSDLEGDTPANKAARHAGKIVMPFSPFEAKAHKVVGATGRISTPVTREHIEINLDGWTATVEQSRQDYDRDMHGTLNQVYRMLARADMKSPDQQVAALLRNGQSAPAWHTSTTGKFFFDTAIPCDHGTGTAGGATYSNYRTGAPLTADNVRKVCEAMTNLKGPDGISLNLGSGDGSMQSGFQLIIPTTLLHTAYEALYLRFIVRGGQNPAPGQPVNTAAQGENVFDILQYVREVVVLPELTDSGAAEDETSWYVQAVDTGPWALAYSLGMTPEYVSHIDPGDYGVYWGLKYSWGWYKYEGVAYGHPQWITKCRAT